MSATVIQFPAVTTALDDMEAIRASFDAYCDEEGYLDHEDPIERLKDLAAAFTWLVATS